MVSLLIYRDWLEHHRDQADFWINSKKADVVTEDSKNALLCPKCNRVMLKYRISSASENRVDLCPNCAEAWLDSGEWILLIQLEMHDKLPTIFTEPWQKHIRKENAVSICETKYEDIRKNAVSICKTKYEELFGEEDYKEIRKIRDWIYNHPKKPEIVYYLNDKDPYS